jgi:hypothetical protein
VVVVFPNRNPNGELSIAKKKKDKNKNNTHSDGYLYQIHSSIALHSPATAPENSLDDPQVYGVYRSIFDK